MFLTSYVFYRHSTSTCLDAYQVFDNCQEELLTKQNLQALKTEIPLYVQTLIKTLNQLGLYILLYHNIGYQC